MEGEGGLLENGSETPDNYSKMNNYQVTKLPEQPLLFLFNCFMFKVRGGDGVNCKLLLYISYIWV